MRRPDLIEDLRNVWALSRSRTTNGPVTTVFKALKFLGWPWQHFDKFGRQNQPDLRWLSYSKEFFHHEIREALRNRNLTCASKRKDLAGISSGGGVDRSVLQQMLKSFKAYSLGTFQAIIAGGLRSAVNFCCVGLIFSPACPFCGLADETVERIFLSCPAWASIRLGFPEVDGNWLFEQPECTKLCCVPLLPPCLSQLAATLWTPDIWESNIPVSNDSLPLEIWDLQFVVIWTDGSCQEQASPDLRRAGYAVVYDASLQRSRTISKALLGPEQTAQRAEVRAVLAALLVEDRPVHIKSESSYVVNAL